MTPKFNKIFEATIHNIESDVWNSALTNSDELAVAIKLMKEIKAKFPDGEIYIVGGVPRDILTGDDVDDVDLATNISFEDLSEFYELRNISKSDSQPVYKINYGGYSLDLAQFREDSEGAVGRNSNVSTLTNNFEADTKRRDLTINSFGLNEFGEIVDYQDGIEDLKRKIVKTVGNAHDRFMEDATRILRVARFAAKMGFEIEEHTRQAMIDLKHVLQNKSMISAESIAKEFYKAAKSGPTLRKFVEHLLDTRIAHDILPEFTAMEDMWHDTEHHPEADGNVIGHILECLSVSPFKDPVVNLAILFHDFGKATTQEFKDADSKISRFHGHEAAGVSIVQSIFDRLRFNELTSDDKKCILNAVEKHMLIHNLPSLNIKTLTKLVNAPCWDVLKKVAYADEASRSGKFDADKFYKKVKDAEANVSRLGDADALRLKIKEIIDGSTLMGWFPELKANPKDIGKVLPALQDMVLHGLNAGKVPTAEQLKSAAEKLLKSN